MLGEAGLISHCDRLWLGSPRKGRRGVRNGEPSGGCFSMFIGFCALPSIRSNGIRDEVRSEVV